MEFSDLKLYSLYSARPIIYIPIEKMGDKLVFFINYGYNLDWEFEPYDEQSWINLDFHFKTITKNRFFNPERIIMAFFEDRLF